MSKYQEFQELFVNDGQTAHDQAGRCFEEIEDLTYQLVDYSGWFSDDVEYVTLSQPIGSAKPAKVKRFNRTGRNRERIREVATAIDGFWSLGIRFRLRPHLSVPFYPPEVMFVMPVLVANRDNQLVIKLEPDGTEYTIAEWGTLIELVFDRIHQILQGGIQTLLGVDDRREELQQLGFVLDTATLKSLHLIG
jgi:hypothetical protein